MIILENLFYMLTTGPYANTTFSGTAGVLKEEHYEKVYNIINLGILEIYKRFNFLENELTLHITPNTRNYYLRAARVAPLASITEALYIEEPLDTNGFLNIIKIKSAYDSSGNELRINNSISSAELLPIIIELSPDTLQITNILTPQAISVLYQAYPNKLTLADCDNPGSYELHISDIIIDPLISYIAAKTFKPTGANDSTANADKSASYEQQYELACQKLDMYGLYIPDHTEKENFNSNGWV
jgi:hypothetical protein